MSGGSKSRQKQVKEYIQDPGKLNRAVASSTTRKRKRQKHELWRGAIKLHCAKAYIE